MTMSARGTGGSSRGPPAAVALVIAKDDAGGDEDDSTRVSYSYHRPQIRNSGGPGRRPSRTQKLHIIRSLRAGAVAMLLAALSLPTGSSSLRLSNLPAAQSPRNFRLPPVIRYTSRQDMGNCVVSTMNFRGGILPRAPARVPNEYEGR